ncbi:PRC-barrel domain-containing protein [Aureimonas glaciei]|uniref:PRC-barrel domain-containing protein n=1 Tax=Aureimonas glaciei TaxID=1776957 RepID=A0A916XWM0_9HYPH|nr:PRC-barrel domain-containing protein [Aureimonas glaciei]GGD15554.1 hypothetical protein GCM10011335_17980 [Aureimonas glaciei]
MKRLLLTATTALLFTAPVFAQTTAPADTTKQTTAPASATTQTPAAATATGADGAAAGAAGGMTRGTTSTVALRFVEYSSADVMASRLDDLDVYNNQNEEIGEIEDLVIRDGKTITGVVVSVGGFLGLGDRYVLLDPSSIVLGDQGGEMRAYVNTSKDELTNAPEFSYDPEEND